jgi:hypothetical protein
MSVRCFTGFAAVVGFGVASLMALILIANG